MRFFGLLLGICDLTLAIYFDNLVLGVMALVLFALVAYSWHLDCEAERAMRDFRRFYERCSDE